VRQNTCPFPEVPSSSTWNSRRNIRSSLKSISIREGKGKEGEKGDGRRTPGGRHGAGSALPGSRSGFAMAGSPVMRCLPPVLGSRASPLLSRGTLRPDRRVGLTAGIDAANLRYRPMGLSASGRGAEREVRKDLLSCSDRSGGGGGYGR
jgi:hypothetical protein